MMTRKDFELIATTVRHLDLGDSTQVYVASMMAEALASANERFDRKRFIDACLPDDTSPLFIAEVQSASHARVDALKEAL